MQERQISFCRLDGVITENLHLQQSVILYSIFDVQQVKPSGKHKVQVVCESHQHEHDLGGLC